MSDNAMDKIENDIVFIMTFLLLGFDGYRISERLLYSGSRILFLFSAGDEIFP